MSDLPARAASSGKTALVAAGAACLAVIAAALWLWFAIAATGARRGTASCLIDIPDIGPVLVDLDVNGPISYGYWYTSNGGASYVLSGRTSESALRGFCDKAGLDFRIHARSWRFDLWPYVQAVGGGRDDFPTDFGPTDAAVIGTNEGIGHVKARFRHADGTFTMTVDRVPACPKQPVSR